MFILNDKHMKNPANSSHNNNNNNNNNNKNNSKHINDNDNDNDSDAHEDNKNESKNNNNNNESKHQTRVWRLNERVKQPTAWRQHERATNDVWLSRIHEAIAQRCTIRRSSHVLAEYEHEKLKSGSCRIKVPKNRIAYCCAQKRRENDEATAIIVTLRRPPFNTLILNAFMFCLLLSFVTPAHADWLMDCGDCHCKWNSGKKTADCKNLTLAAVPENLSSEVQVLDLSYNRIPYLEQNAFLNAQLQNLHKLFIRNSTLHQIDPRTFTQLEILIELDLSNNLLRALQPNLFARLIKVRALVLNGNLLESLVDGLFQNLKYLHKVELKHNRLMRIGTQAFVSVPLLSQIYLDGNQLSFLRKESFESLKRLTALSLDQNPWNCTCELQIFRDFVLKRNLYTPPTSCYYPLNLRGMLWIEDQPEAFACKPKIIYPARGASINTSKENVTLICRVHASPNTMIAWDYNKQMYRANAISTSLTSTYTGSSLSSSSSSASSASVAGASTVLGPAIASSSAAGSQNQRVHIQLLRDEQSKEKEFGRDVFISRLTILGAEKSDEGIYTCLAENAGGKDAVQMSLLVQKPGPRDLLLQGNLIIVICLMALGLLSVSVFLAMVTCCIYKRFKLNMNPGSGHRHLHHLNHITSEQLGHAVATAGDHTTTNVVVAGGTDVMLGGSGGTADDDDSSLSNYKQQQQQQQQQQKQKQLQLQQMKANLNGGTGLKHSKYADVIKQHKAGDAAGTSPDNGIIVGYVSGGTAMHTGNEARVHHQLILTGSGSGSGGGGGGGGGIGGSSGADLVAGYAEKTFLERNNEDALNVKYPHGAVQTELSYATIGHGTTRSSSAGSGNRTADEPNRHLDSPNSSGGHIELVGRTLGGEYQPDLLPAYNSKASNNNKQPISPQQQQQQQQQQHLYSPLKSTTRTIMNSKEDHHHHHQYQQPTTTTTTTTTGTAITSRSKYNINVQEYLQAKYGTIGGVANSKSLSSTVTSAYNNNNTKHHAMAGDKCNKREAPSLPLTTTASLNAALMIAGGGSRLTNTGYAVSQESGFSTLQRHCKSLAVPTTQRTSASSTTTPTDNQQQQQQHGGSSKVTHSYEYRQPPPPPYNAAHRTSSSSGGSGSGGGGGGVGMVSGLLSLQRRTSAALAEREEQHDTLAALATANTITTATRQTIVTASPSLNFLTTTGGYTPRRQLL